MGNTTKTSKLFSLMLTLGGAFGIALGIYFTLIFLQESWLNALLFLPFSALFTWSLCIGVSLWRGNRYGRKWAPIIFASQVPIIATPLIEVHWFTGFQLGPSIAVIGDSISASLAFNFGSNMQFWLGGGGDQTLFGINIFAAVAAFYLVRENKLLREDLEVENDVSNEGQQSGAE